MTGFIKRKLETQRVVDFFCQAGKQLCIDSNQRPIIFLSKLEPQLSNYKFQAFWGDCARNLFINLLLDSTRTRVGVKMCQNSSPTFLFLPLGLFEHGVGHCLMSEGRSSNETKEFPRSGHRNKSPRRSHIYVFLATCRHRSDKVAIICSIFYR